MKRLIFLTAVVGVVLSVVACRNKSHSAGRDEAGTFSDTLSSAGKTDTLEPPLALIPVEQAVTIGGYFKFMDDLIRRYDTLAPYDLNEHLLVRANPWLIDTLENTDYYRQMARGNFVYDQKKMIVLRPGDTLRVPGPKAAAALLYSMNNTRLDINIPAFRLRIIEGDSTLYSFPCRVGKNTEKFLAVVGHEVDLRTHTGTGEIIRISKASAFRDPVTGEKLKVTKRDDRKTTRMPLIPWMEPSIDGIRYGQMIHPTTNPRTLGKPASNGCIGLKEADAWRVYYYAPIGTKVMIRYDLMEINEAGDTLRFNDVYHREASRK
ncbi:MAG TPA: L,D-transpeptidase, partial [Saprospiraceae bacterium]|nr:L,D-transpeptidase [Saprospiraceae bacterium]